MTKGKAKRMKGARPGKDVFKGKDFEWKGTDGKMPYLETDIDQFYQLVKNRKSINFSDAARESGVSRDQIVSWSRILEDHKLAKVHYPVFGNPLIFLAENEKPKEAGKEKKLGKKSPKIIIALVGGLMVFFGYVMLVSNPFTISMRSNLVVAAARVTALFGFLPYPLNIIIPVAIIIAVLLLVISFKHRRKQYVKEKTKPKRRPKEMEDKIGKIKKELGS